MSNRHMNQPEFLSSAVASERMCLQPYRFSVAFQAQGFGDWATCDCAGTANCKHFAHHVCTPLHSGTASP